MRICDYAPTPLCLEWTVLRLLGSVSSSHTNLPNVLPYFLRWKAEVPSFSGLLQKPQTQSEQQQEKEKLSTQSIIEKRYVRLVSSAYLPALFRNGSLRLAKDASILALKSHFFFCRESLKCMLKWLYYKLIIVRIILIAFHRIRVCHGKRQRQRNGYKGQEYRGLRNGKCKDLHKAFW